MIRRPPRSTQSRSSAASDVYKRQVHPEVGIAPGSPVATLELAMVLAVDIRRLRHAYPAASFLVHVDDVSFQLQHKDPVPLAKEMVCIAADVVHNIEREVGLRCSLQKAKIKASVNIQQHSSFDDKGHGWLSRAA